VGIDWTETHRLPAIERNYKPFKAVAPLAIPHYLSADNPAYLEKDDLINKNESFFYKKTFGLMGQFWATVAMVEIMDLAFSIDNVFAAVAFTDKLGLIWIGVFIGILAMRFVAQAFVSLMEKYPFLEYAAFIVIAILGVKLTISIVTHFMPESGITKFLDSESTDLIISGITVAIFAVPLATSFLFNFPKKAIKE
jgi:YkoY family integral membrane protein